MFSFQLVAYLVVAAPLEKNLFLCLSISIIDSLCLHIPLLNHYLYISKDQPRFVVLFININPKIKPEINEKESRKKKKTSKKRRNQGGGGKGQKVLSF